MTVTVARYFEPSEAHVVRALLESAGLAATVADDHHVTANYPISTALGGVRVQVPAADVDAARKLIAAYESGELERDLESGSSDGEAQCPGCGSSRLSRRLGAGETLLALAVFAVGGATFPSRDTQVKCLACGRSWARAD